MIDLAPACRGMAGVLAGIGGEHLDAPTPCTEFTVRQLVAHVDEVATGSAALAREAAGAPAAEAPDTLPRRLAALAEAWAAPAAWTGRSAPFGVDLPNTEWGLIALTEMVVHGWDLARATGRELQLPEETLRACHAHVLDFVPRAPLPQLWGPPARLPDSTPLIDRIAAATGRRV